MRVIPELLPSVPVWEKPQEGRALPHTRDAQGLRGIPCPSSRAEGRLRWRLPPGSLLMLFPAALILLLPSPRQGDFWEMRHPRGAARAYGGVLIHVHTSICV